MENPVSQRFYAEDFKPQVVIGHTLSVAYMPNSWHYIKRACCIIIDIAQQHTYIELYILVITNIIVNIIGNNIINEMNCCQ